MEMIASHNYVDFEVSSSKFIKLLTFKVGNLHSKLGRKEAEAGGEVVPEALCWMEAEQVMFASMGERGSTLRWLTRGSTRDI